MIRWPPTGRQANWSTGLIGVNKCHYVKHHYAKCPYDKCHYPWCCSAIFLRIKRLFLDFTIYLHFLKTENSFFGDMRSNKTVRGWFVDHQLVDRPTGRLCQLVDRTNRSQLFNTLSSTVNWSTGLSFLSTGRLDNWLTSYVILYNWSTGRQILIYYIWRVTPAPIKLSLLIFFFLFFFYFESVKEI